MVGNERQEDDLIAEVELFLKLHRTLKPVGPALYRLLKDHLKDQGFAPQEGQLFRMYYSFKEAENILFFFTLRGEGCELCGANEKLNVVRVQDTIPKRWQKRLSSLPDVTLRLCPNCDAETERRSREQFKRPPTKADFNAFLFAHSYLMTLRALGLTQPPG